MRALQWEFRSFCSILGFLPFRGYMSVEVVLSATSGILDCWIVSFDCFGLCPPTAPYFTGHPIATLAIDCSCAFTVVSFIQYALILMCCCVVDFHWSCWIVSPELLLTAASSVNWASYLIGASSVIVDNPAAVLRRRKRLD